MKLSNEGLWRNVTSYQIQHGRQGLLPHLVSPAKFNFILLSEQKYNA